MCCEKRALSVPSVANTGMCGKTAAITAAAAVSCCFNLILSSMPVAGGLALTDPRLKVWWRRRSTQEAGRATKVCPSR